MKCPYARIETDRHGDEYVVCDKYDKTFDYDGEGMGGERCDEGIFDL